MNEKEFMVMARLTVTGNPSLQKYRSGKIYYGDMNTDDISVPPTMFNRMLKKKWIAQSPYHTDDCWYATEIGVRETLVEAKKRLRDYIDVCPNFTSTEIYHNVGLNVAGSLERMGLVGCWAGTGYLDGKPTTLGNDVIAGKELSYKSFEDIWKPWHEEKTAPPPPSPVAKPVSNIPVWEVGKDIHEARNRESLERNVLDLAKKAFLQQASYDDLMEAVEKLLIQEQKSPY